MVRTRSDALFTCDECFGCFLEPCSQVEDERTKRRVNITEHRQQAREGSGGCRPVVATEDTATRRDINFPRIKKDVCFFVSSGKYSLHSKFPSSGQRRRVRSPRRNPDECGVNPDDLADDMRGVRVMATSVDCCEGVRGDLVMIFRRCGVLRRLLVRECDVWLSLHVFPCTIGTGVGTTACDEIGEYRCAMCAEAAGTEQRARECCVASRGRLIRAGERCCFAPNKKTGNDIWKA